MNDYIEYHGPLAQPLYDATRDSWPPTAREYLTASNREHLLTCSHLRETNPRRQEIPAGYSRIRYFSHAPRLPVTLTATWQTRSCSRSSGFRYATSVTGGTCRCNRR